MKIQKESCKEKKGRTDEKAEYVRKEERKHERKQDKESDYNLLPGQIQFICAMCCNKLNVEIMQICKNYSTLGKW